MDIKCKRRLMVGLIIIWIVVVFCFSQQPGDESSKSSLKIVDSIVNVITNIKQFNNEELIIITQNLSFIIRKLAHIFIYTVGGILIFILTDTYNTKLKNKIIFTYIFTVLYAITDEIHQLFIEGRAGQFSDVMIDSIGIIFAITLMIVIKSVRSRNASVYVNQKGKHNTGRNI